MSGARALASARRRRAEPQPNQSLPINSSSRASNNMTSIREETPLQEKPKMSPAMMLLSHNKIIENLQTVVESLNFKIEQQEEDMKKLIENKMNDSKADDTNLEYYKQKIDTIDSNLEEIKKHTLKVQTFSMETNLQLVEVKKKLNKYEKNEQNNEAKQREQIIEHINNVSTILTKINNEVEQGKEAQNIQNNTLIDILEGINNNVTGENVIEISEEQEEPVEEQEEPVEDQEEPVEDQEEPVEDQEEPVEDQEEPVEDQEEPVEDQEEPVEDQEEPVEEQEEPVEDQEEPVEDQELNEEGEESTKLNF